MVTLTKVPPHSATVPKAGRERACFENDALVGEGGGQGFRACAANQGTVGKDACVGTSACIGNSGLLEQGLVARR